MLIVNVPYNRANENTITEEVIKSTTLWKANAKPLWQTAFLATFTCLAFGRASNYVFVCHRTWCVTCWHVSQTKRYLFKENYDKTPLKYEQRVKQTTFIHDVARNIQPNLRQQKAIQCSIHPSQRKAVKTLASFATKKQGITVAWADTIYLKKKKITLAEVQQTHREQLDGAVGDSIHCNTGLWFKIDVPHDPRRGPESEGRLFSMFKNRGGFLLTFHFNVSVV